MTVIIGSSTSRKGKAAVIKQAPVRSGVSSFSGVRGSADVPGFNQFWDLMDVIKRHGYMSAAMKTFGRSVVSSGWGLRKHSEYGDIATDSQRRKLMDFYLYSRRTWTNIKDFHPFPHKLLSAAMYLRYFGQAAFAIFRNSAGEPLGFDFLPGYVVPNVDRFGKFSSPAFYQYPTRNPADRVEFERAEDIVFITNPDWEGKPVGGSDIEPLLSYVLPLDIYLMTAAREYMRNRDKPEVVYGLPSDISSDAFDTFVEQMQANHAGAGNLGRNPIVIQGELKVHELRDLPKGLPYQDSREHARKEEMAVAGVNSAKLGIMDGVSAANFREIRREFHQTSLGPVLTLIEFALYEQVHVRTFGFSGWEFKFDSPDFLTAVERATVHMRYIQMGVLSPNEVRYELGKPSRDDGGWYVDLTDVEDPDAYPGNGGNPGSPPEGREEEPDDPGNIQEPVMEDDPIRGDGRGNPGYSLSAMRNDIVAWRRFASKRLRRGKALRPFNSGAIPPEIKMWMDDRLHQAATMDDALAVFDIVLDQIS